MTPQSRVFPKIHTSYNIYELLIHEMTHDTANEGDPGLVSRSAPIRGSPGTSPKQTGAVRGAGPGRARNQLGRGLGRIRPDRADTGPPPPPGKDLGIAPPPAAPSSSACNPPRMDVDEACTFRLPTDRPATRAGGTCTAQTGVHSEAQG